MSQQVLPCAGASSSSQGESVRAVVPKEEGSWTEIKVEEETDEDVKKEEEESDEEPARKRMKKEQNPYV